MAGNTGSASRKALRNQAIACESLGSGFMGQLCNLLAERLCAGSPVADRVLNWTGDVSSSGHSVPLRLAGALHRLVLTDQDAQLSAAYPPNRVDNDTLWSAVSEAMAQHSDDILTWLNSPPQTNEVRRASAIIAAAQVIAQRHDLPMMVSELGASAGLNLNWHQFRLDLPGHSFGPTDAPVVLQPEWRGETPPAAQITVTDRCGVDLAPVDTNDPDDRVRLKSYLWPDQPHRLNLTEAAMALELVPVDQGDAIDWLGRRLPQQKDGTLHMVYHTIAWQYFPKSVQIAGQRLIEKAGARATKSKPLAWFSMEADNHGPGAGLTLRLWPGDHRINLGRADFHGRWIDWRASGPCSLPLL